MKLYDGRNNDTNLVRTCLHLFKLVCSGFLQLLATFAQEKIMVICNDWCKNSERAHLSLESEINIGTLHAEGFEQETNWLYVHLLTVKSELTANSQYYIGLDLSIYRANSTYPTGAYVPAAAAADSTKHSGSKLQKPPKISLGGPPLTQKSLTGFPLPRFLAYVRARGGFLR